MAFDQILVELQGVFGDDRRIAESAWTSSYSNGKKEFKTDEDVSRVVKMLGGSSPPHGVPFESVVLYFWIRLPIAVDRQFMTHRMQSANGMSGRYRTMPADFYLAPQDIKELTDKTLVSNDGMLLSSEVGMYNFHCETTNRFYRETVDTFRKAMDNGKITNAEFKRLREFYRGVLPQHNFTERTTTINLRSFANFQKQRNDSHAQPEIRYIAQRMLEEVETSGKIPVALAVLKENKWVV